ncbi:ATP-binding cassette domain-containing protein, partial [Burkholderia contaminans]|uniref:ATP-binding cassette domain-containing protein n=1 Tax=Burkholderia contaminans TaxID=488447 RepID=UPI0028F44309
MNLLELDDLCLAYDTPHGRRTVVDGLSLALPRGDIGCLLGASGCGKTTVLRAIAGFEPVRMGRIVLDGVPVAAPSLDVPPERRRIGMMFQDYALFPHLSAADNVAFGRPGQAQGPRRQRGAGIVPHRRRAASGGGE